MFHYRIMTETRFAIGLRAVFLLAAATALAGGYWDDAWHTERGRDSFFIAPHLAIYGGVTMAGLVLGVMTLRRAESEGWREALDDRTLRLAAVALAVTVLSAPVDNAWHVAFGRDAVLWSPPHMLGIVGAMGLAFAMLLQSGDGDRAGDVMAGCAASLVLAAATFAVAEYETDVPQFAAIWYPVVFAFAASVGFALVRAAWPARWTATVAAGGHAAFMGVVTAAVVLLGFEAPGPPVLLLLGPLVDVAARRGWGTLLTATALTASTMLLVVPVRQRFSALGLDVDDAALAVPLVWLASAAGLVIVSGRVGFGGRGLRLLVSGLALFGLLAGSASAHDPGQGASAGAVRWDARVRGADAAVSVSTKALCDATQARLLARRGGAVVTGTLGETGCARRGRIRLPQDGRWFVYLDGDRPDGRFESWIPLTAGDTARHALVREGYRPPRRRGGALKWSAGLVMYAVIGILLVAFGRLARGAAPGARTPRATTGPAPGAR